MKPLRRAATLLGTVRGRIFAAFFAMTIITGSLGLYATVGIREAGILVARTYDQSLMSINYARAASADFARMRSAFARRALSTEPAAQARLDAEIADLMTTLAEDLVIAAERSQSDRAARAAAAVQGAVASWDEIRRGLDGAAGSASQSAGWDALDRQAAFADVQLELLVNYTAGDGFTYRQMARNRVADEIRFYAVATIVALLLSGLVAWALARRITGPLAAASAVAERIAAGRLDGAIPAGYRDELGALLGAMATMRDNIRAMMEREVSQRRSAQVLLADALEGSREGVVVVDAAGQVALANAQAAEFFGGIRSGTAVADLALAGADPATRALAEPSLAQDGEIRLADGRWLRISRSATQAGGYVAVCSDISVLKEQEAGLTAMNLRLDAALDNMSQGLCLYDAGSRLILVNRRYSEIYRLPPDAVRLGMHAQEVLAACLAAGNHPGRTLADMLGEERDAFGRADSLSATQELGDGRVIAIERRATADGGFVATYEDVTERRNAEARLAFMAGHDALTELPNRVLLTEQIEAALAQPGHAGFAVFSLDLDDFKTVNDTLGHVVGDALIQAAASRAQACLRDTDMVARLGADEFAILQRGVERAEDAAVLAKRLVDVLSASYVLSGHRVDVGVSIGVSLAPLDGTSADRLLQNADVALDRAKAEARGTFRFFEPDMDARLRARRELERDLREAVADQAFEVYYQPIYDLRAERICGFEALLRWKHPVRGFVSPGEFIPLAEELGLIVPLGEWVLRQACHEAVRWPGDIKVAVNVSAVQFTSASLITATREALRTSGLPGRRLELEITESVLVGQPGTATTMLHSLKSLGVRVSMDDFGTGYSSLSYLRSFPFDKIKIDQSFVRDLCAQDGTGFIVRAVISMGSSLRMTTTAEGVETEEQLALLRAEGCDEVQGYLFSRPVPAVELPPLIRRWNGEIRAIA
ncbi:EAL domain-containing protein [Methylobacterium sp. A54F]